MTPVWVSVAPFCLPMLVFGLVLVWRPALQLWVIGLLYAALVAITTIILTRQGLDALGTGLPYGVALAFVWAGFWLWRRRILPKGLAFGVALLSVPALLVMSLWYSCDVKHDCL